MFIFSPVFTVSEAMQTVDMVYLWLGVFVLDVCVFSLTVRKTQKLRKDVPSRIVAVIMRDGKACFASRSVWIVTSVCFRCSIL